MKTLLAILLSFIVTEAPVFAIHGGYTLGGTGDVTGTYAGVLIPTSDTITSGTSSEATTTSGTSTGNSAAVGEDSLGLFTLNVPSTGVATGNLVVFTAGRTFAGTMQGFPDPSDPNGVTGLVQAFFNFSIIEATTTIGTNGAETTTLSTVDIAATANGSFHVDTSTSAASTQSPTGVLISGSATLDIDQGTVADDGSPIIDEVVAFDIEGFQQTNSANAGADTFTLPTQATAP